MIRTDLNNYTRCRRTYHDTEMRGLEDISISRCAPGATDAGICKTIPLLDSHSLSPLPSQMLPQCIAHVQPSEPRQLLTHRLIYGLAHRRAIRVLNVVKLVNGAMCPQGKLIPNISVSLIRIKK
jgi:hypothetical protein